MGRIFRQLTITDRRKIEKMYLSGEKAKDMADTREGECQHDIQGAEAWKIHAQEF